MQWVPIRLITFTIHIFHWNANRIRYFNSFVFSIWVFRFGIKARTRLKYNLKQSNQVRPYIWSDCMWDVMFCNELKCGVSVLLFQLIQLEDQLTWNELFFSSCYFKSRCSLLCSSHLLIHSSFAVHTKCERKEKMAKSFSFTFSQDSDLLFVIHYTNIKFSSIYRWENLQNEPNFSCSKSFLSILSYKRLFTIITYY